MWVRGLKLENIIIGPRLKKVAPRVGAWIETSVVESPRSLDKSHPVWVRGLKLLVLYLAASVLSRTPCGCVD